MSFVVLDSETSGLDLYFSSRPFFITSCTDEGKSRQWEWAVNPLTREVRPDFHELAQIRQVIASHETVVCHNSKFDLSAFRSIGIDVPWSKVEDTLVAAHVLDSSSGHRLDELAQRYLGENITTHEAKLETAVKTGRRRIQSARLKDKRGTGSDGDLELAKWKIAVEGMADLPSAKGGGADGEGKLWRNDYWLPAALVKAYPSNPEFTGFATVLAEYAEIDSSVTALLWPVLRDELVKRGLWAVYRAKFAAVPAAYRMETRGVTINKTVLDAARDEYTEEADYLGELCVGIAKSMGYNLTLPKSTTNHSLDDFVFGRAMHVNGKRDPKAGRLHRLDTLNLISVKQTDSGNPSFDYDAREMFLAELTPGTKPYLFVESFGRRCELDTGLSYLAGYDRYVLPLEKTDACVQNHNSSKVLAQRSEEFELLGMDGGILKQRLRTDSSGGAEHGTPSVVHNSFGANSEGTVCPPQVRQQEVRSSRSSVSRDVQGQQRGHGSQGETSEGGSERIADSTGASQKGGQSSKQGCQRETSSRVEDGVCSGRSIVLQVGEEKRTEEGNNCQHHLPSNLETHPLSEWVVLHPNLNCCGTATTRWSHNNPNSANISKQSAVNLRRCFGPAQGREWYSMDAANIELRIPAYLAGERELIDVFERPNDPPYYGSYHLLVFDTVHPVLFAEHGKNVKMVFEDSWYQWVKNANFARQYGAQEVKVDATFRVKGAYKKIAQRFPKIDALNRRIVKHARETGGVTTLPDCSVDPKQGYPLTCRRGEWGISPTIPFAYFVSGTAGFWLNQAVVRCDAQLEAWRRDEGYDGYMILSVHDELVFDLPVLRSVDRVISGGQTGADQAGLRAGRKSGRTTGGFINRGFKTLDGPNPSLVQYGLEELDTDDYPVRTARNVEEATATIRFATDFSSAGEKCTANAIRRFSRPSLDVNPNSPPPLNEVVKWFDSHAVRTLNVAGNTERTSPGIGVFAEKFLTDVLAADNKNLPRVATLRKLMEQGGTDIGVPTPVEIERHSENWAEGVKIK